MSIKEELKNELVNLKDSETQFEQLALEVFQYQASQNPLYKLYLKNLGKKPRSIKRLEKIPFLPITFFKNHPVICKNTEAKLVFESSGTTGSINAKHLVSDPELYKLLSQKTFEQFYGNLSNYHIFALLPGYLERQNSSLVYMVQHFIEQSFSPISNFYLHNHNELIFNLKSCLADEKDQRKILIIGVTHALLDLAEKIKLEPNNRLIVMETGGMKGKRKEMLREEVHEQLQLAFGLSHIDSEYGMTELLSQAYSRGHGLFETAKTLKVFIREVNDPFNLIPSFKIGQDESVDRTSSRTGGLNIIDLANIDTCAFIETQDLGCYANDYEYFKVLGRFDNSDLRGCNLMV